MTPTEIIKKIAPEFAGITDIDWWVELTTPLVSKAKFCALYEQAVALLTCHRMKMAGLGDNEFAGKVGDTLRVGNYSEGSRSIGFTVNQGTNLLSDAELALTSYGLQYLSIRRSVVVSITSAGGANNGYGL